MKLLTTQDLETMTGIPARTFDQYAYRGIGPEYVKLGRHRRYRPEAIEAWVNANTRGGPDAPAA